MLERIQNEGYCLGPPWAPTGGGVARRQPGLPTSITSSDASVDERCELVDSSTVARAGFDG
jgi:hypothetical protein